MFLASVGARYQLVLLLRTAANLPKQPFMGMKWFALRKLANHPFSLNTAYYAVGYLDLGKGAIDKAISLLEHDLEICRLWSIQQNLPRVAVALGCAYAAAGRVGEALPLLDLVKERVRLSSDACRFSPGLSFDWQARRSPLVSQSSP